MGKKFNVTGTCIPEENYMVDITGKLEQIKVMIDAKEYFIINRGRQYGKTTTLSQLRHFLADEYTVISISFEGMDEEEFKNAENFCQTFIRQISRALRFTSESIEYKAKWKNSEVKSFAYLSEHITDMCEGKKLVLMIDEVDKASNNRVFLGLLSVLRAKYLARRDGMDFTFHSVILAGVYDITDIKLRLIKEGFHTPTLGETIITNSPWNIAAQFNVDMSFSADEVETMLREYEKDHQTGMDIPEIAGEIFDFTNGYPVLVSNICKRIDEMLSKKWNVDSVHQAVKQILQEESLLFQSLIKNLTGDKELYDLVYHIIMNDFRLPFNFQVSYINLGYRYGFLKNYNNRVAISNRIFEICLTNYFINHGLHDKIKATPLRDTDEKGIIVNGKFNMQVCLEKFAKYYDEYYADQDVKFIEIHGRYFVLFFISSILNGHGFVHLESQSTDRRKRDLIVNYFNQQFIIELKIWRSPKRHQDAFTQLLGYMDKRGLNEGYLLTFDFRQKKDLKQEWIDVEGGKKIFNVIV